MYFDSIVGQSGVKNLSRIQLDKMLAGKSAGASIGIDELFETASGYSTPQDFETMLQLVYLKFTDVNFDRQVFDSVIDKQKKSLQSALASPQYYFSEQVFKITTQNHLRAFNPFDLSNPDKAKFEDIQTIYKDRFADASGFTFVFVGNLEPEKIKPQIVKYLGNLPSANRRETWKDWGVNPPAGPLEKVFRKGVDDKSVVQMIYTGEAAYSRDEARSLAALGELLTIKLLEVLREEKGGVYGVGASGVLNKIPSERYAFVVRFACAPKNVESLVAATTSEIAKIQNGQIDEAEIAKVKEKRLVNIEESFKNNGYWMSAINTELTQDVPLLTLDEAKARINHINKADLQKAAHKYLKPKQKLQFVLMPETAAATKSETAGQTQKFN